MWWCLPFQIQIVAIDPQHTANSDKESSGSVLELGNSIRQHSRGADAGLIALDEIRRIDVAVFVDETNSELLWQRRNGLARLPPKHVVVSA